jgi:hypothetical protein
LAKADLLCSKLQSILAKANEKDRCPLIPPHPPPRREKAMRATTFLRSRLSEEMGIFEKHAAIT